MAKKKPLRIGLIGYGFMGRARSKRFPKFNFFPELKYEPQLAAVCATMRALPKSSLPNGVECGNGLEKLVARDDIGVIDSAPNNVHHDIAIAAAKAGKGILLRKAFALNCKKGEAMVKEVEKAGVANMVWYNYRRIPAVTLAEKMIDEGRLGKVYHCQLQTFFRTGQSVKIFHREVKVYGAWMPR